MNWKNKAIELAKTGRSWRKIAQDLGVSKSTVSDYLRKTFKAVEVKSSPSYAKILFLDIETKPIIFQGWAMFNQNFGLEQIQEDWTILSYSAKWLHNSDVIYSDVTEKTEDDLLEELHNLLNEAHVVVGHNADRFDIPKIRARMIARGFSPYSPVRIIDTLKIAKEEFKFTSNRLAYLTNLLCKNHKKLDHEKFAGHRLWKEFLKGNPEAIQCMREYNMCDVTSLEELFFILMPWSKKLVNFDVYFEEDVDMSVWEQDGYWYTNLGKYAMYRNKVTGAWKRGRTNLLSKEKRSQLLANIG